MRTWQDIGLRLVLGTACSALTILWTGHLVGGGGGYGAEMALAMFILPVGAAVAGLLCGAVSVSLPRESPEKRERALPIFVGAELGLVGGILAVEARCLVPTAWDFRRLEHEGVPLLLFYALPLALACAFVHVLFDWLARSRK